MELSMTLPGWLLSIYVEEYWAMRRQFGISADVKIYIDRERRYNLRNSYLNLSEF